MVAQVLSKTVFRAALREGWSLGVIPQKILPEKTLVKLEFEWNSDGSLRAIRRILTCPSCRSEFQQKSPDHQFCSFKCWRRANSARLNKKRRDKYAKNPGARKRELDRCWRYYHLRGGREVRIRYKHLYTKNRYSLPAGFPLNLNVCVANGQERIVDAVRLEKAVKHGWRNSPFNVYEE